MAKIERVAFFLADPAGSPLLHSGLASDLKDLERTGFPEVKIGARPTTASLSDYAHFDLSSISRGEYNAVLSDGATS